ncbi:glutathione synthase [Arthrobacter ginkgonis]|uniref:Glutathione synthase n=1 Tax=Arthrobacter ginkgonis TaxID=1630594 RepID=A0ABP7C9M9_9MICC
MASHSPATVPSVYVIHENPEWFPPLAAAFAAEGVPAVEWLLTTGSINLTDAPPPGVFWSRMSASAHTRGHGASKEYTRAVLAWLQAHGRRVVNGSSVLELEVSKVAQQTALAAAGFDVPRTVAVFGKDTLAEEARTFALPFITKHNQGGKGLGVRRFDSYAEFDAYVASDGFEEPADGITLLQEFLQAAEPFITRAEFVGGRFVYAVKVDTSSGSFELCPADACVVPEAAGPKFSLRQDADRLPVIRQYEEFLAAHGIEVAGVEFIETSDGRLVTYDINTNTNYNPDVEAVAPRSGPAEIARFLGAQLAEAARPSLVAVQGGAR